MSKEEYEAAKEYITPIDMWWWLRSPGENNDHVAFVNRDHVDEHGNYVNDWGTAVRPALKIRNFDSLGVKEKDSFVFGGYTWTVISNEIALCDKAVWRVPFRENRETEDANIFEKSDVKKWLKRWAKRNNIKTRKINIPAISANNLQIEEVTLLSAEEYKETKENIEPLDNWWWLRSPGFKKYYADFVYSDGMYKEGGFGVDIPNVSVRPVLKIKNIESLSFTVDDSFKMGGYIWTVISKDLVLCDQEVCKMMFRKDWQAEDANMYESSDIKEWLTAWTKELY